MSLASYRAAPPRVRPLSGTCLSPAGREWNYTPDSLGGKSLGDEFQRYQAMGTVRRRGKSGAVGRCGAEIDRGLAVARDNKRCRRSRLARSAACGLTVPTRHSQLMTANLVDERGLAVGWHGKHAGRSSRLPLTFSLSEFRVAEGLRFREAGRLSEGSRRRRRDLLFERDISSRLRFPRRPAQLSVAFDRCFDPVCGRERERKREVVATSRF